MKILKNLGFKKLAQIGSADVDYMNQYLKKKQDILTSRSVNRDKVEILNSKNPGVSITDIIKTIDHGKGIKKEVDRTSNKMKDYLAGKDS